MSSKSLVSIIIIFLNAEKFVQEAIESVLSQTYWHWELLLVDDGSTDASTEIARRYAVQSSDKVRYFEHPNHQNRGMSASRNLGIRHARGEYIAFLDADDVWLPHKLEQQAAILTSQPEAAMVYGKTEYWYSWTGNPEDSPRDHIQPHGVEANMLYRPPVLLPLFLRGKAAVPPPSSIILRRKVVEGIGGFEEGFLGLYMIFEDQAFYAKICIAAPVFVSNQCWDKYRQHPDSSCSTAAKKAGQIHYARLIYLEWAAAYLSKQRCENIKVWLALKRELWLYRHYRHPLRLPFPEYTQYPIRLTKKWLLRLEDLLLPAPIRRWLWSQRRTYEYYPPKEIL